MAGNKLLRHPELLGGREEYKCSDNNYGNNVAAYLNMITFHDKLCSSREVWS